MSSKIPKITQVLELCLYSRSLPKSVEFYSKTLNLGTPSISSERLAVFPLGQTMLILFQRSQTSNDSILPHEMGTIPGHGLDPSPENDKVNLKTHFALAVEKKEEVDQWEERFKEEKVEVLGEVEWPGGGKSVYFQDPDGNVGEIASRGIWPPHY
ncbi:uncharacterized protein JCM6883_004350 [Sporobolomyces salmoneus]|uniref:uncharacterized protein n=1 Tax=Sporobolomyces salmoneus TaxID=183962 RepID=UPI00316ECFFE